MKTGECAYCGIIGPVTKDHIPPKSFFPQPRPSNLITVPCCEICHEKTKLNDEYVFTKFSMHCVVENHSEGAKCTSQLLAGLAKKEKRRFLERLSIDIRNADLISHSGLYLGEAPAYTMDRPRVDAFGNRIARALYYRELGTPVHAEFSINLFWADSTIGESLATVESIGKHLMSIGTGGFTEIGNGVFKYKILICDDDRRCCEIVFEFFDYIFFISQISPPEP